ncbi:hypothetical protein I5I61_26740 [Pseudomonas nitroreducens]|uniref:TniQ family protein n=1 Tax=Pseudomonas nitroreducens TaxID=46680 RepID=A0ABS0KSX2_PSENT|nr:hypothetical protein [Pseudomonas nitroreducens]MBG6291069.1 hypothetical protein [Pseudomonas nitroreducens]
MIEMHYIPMPLEEESPFSLLQRATMMNGFKNSRIFLESKDLVARPSKNPAYEDSAFARFLCRIAEKQRKDVKDSFHRTSRSNKRGKQTAVNGILINTKLLRLSSAATCSECIKEGWEKVISEFAPAENCPYHNRKYLFCCPGCGRKLTHLNRTHGGCICQHELTSPHCSAVEASLELKLLELFRSCSQEKMDTFIKVLTTFKWQQKSHNNSDRRIITEIALSVCRGEITHIAELIKSLYRINEHEILDTNFIIAMMKPCISRKMLQSLREVLSNKARKSGRMHLLPCCLSAKRLQTYLEVNSSHWELIYNHPRFPCPGRKYQFTPREISTIVSIQNEILSQRKIEIENLRKKKTLTLKEAADRLLLTDAALRDLTQTEFLKEEVRHYAICRRVSVRNIEKFESKFITLTQLEQQINRPRSEIRRAIKNLNTYRIPLPHGDKHTIIVERSSITDIETYTSNKKTNRNLNGKHSTHLPRVEDGREKSLYTCIEAGKKLRLDHTTICQLVRANILRSHYQGNHGKYLIEASDVENFNSKYIFAQEVSAKLKTPANQTSDILIQHNIRPVTGRRVDGEPIVVFLRSDITPELIKKITHNNNSFAASFKLGDLITTLDAASMLGISRHTAITIKKLIITPFRPEHFKNHSKLSSAEVRKMREYLENHLPTAVALTDAWMSRRDLNEFLIKPSLVQEIIINGEPHTTIEHAKMIIDFEQRYCTCRGADILLDAPKGHIKWAVRTGRVKAVSPPHGIRSPQTLLDRREIEKMTYTPRGKNTL